MEPPGQALLASPSLQALYLLLGPQASRVEPKKLVIVNGDDPLSRQAQEIPCSLTSTCGPHCVLAAWPRVRLSGEALTGCLERSSQVQPSHCESCTPPQPQFSFDLLTSLGCENLPPLPTAA